MHACTLLSKSVPCSTLSTRYRLALNCEYGVQEGGSTTVPVPGAVPGDSGSAPGFWKGTTSPWHMAKLEAQPSVQTGFRSELADVSLAEVSHQGWAYDLFYR